MIYATQLITNHSESVFQGKLDHVIRQFQEQGLVVEVQFDAERAYNALVIARAKA